MFIFIANKTNASLAIAQSQSDEPVRLAVSPSLGPSAQASAVQMAQNTRQMPNRSCSNSKSGNFSVCG